MVGAACGFAMNMTVGVGSFLTKPYPVTLNSTVADCPGNLTVSDDLLYGKYVRALQGIDDSRYD